MHKHAVLYYYYYLDNVYQKNYYLDKNTRSYLFMQYIHRYSQKSREKSMYILIGLVIAVLIRLLQLLYISHPFLKRESKRYTSQTPT